MHFVRTLLCFFCTTTVVNLHDKGAALWNNNICDVLHAREVLSYLYTLFT
jgi:hypothetical protein